MNKTISINIKGLVFNIEEEAYQVLEKYLNILKDIFTKEEGSDEIMDDIESRIAELFAEKLSNQYQAITTSDVDDVILIMGKPEDYALEDDVEPAAKPSPGTNAPNDTDEEFNSKSKRLYRDMDNAVVGGVCSGLAHYLGWNVLWVRVFFILFAFSGFSIILYVVLYLLVPIAESTNEKLHMTGEPINIENIKKKVNEGFEETKETFKKVSRDLKNEKTKLGSFVKNILDAIVELLRLVGRFFKKAYGIILISLGILLLFVVISTLIAADSVLFSATKFSFYDLELLFVHDSGMITLAFLGLGLIVFSILFSLLYNGIRIVFNLYDKIKGLSLLLIGLTIFGTILISVVIINNVGYHSSHEQVSSTLVADPLQGDTLYVSLINDPYFNKNLKYDKALLFDLIKIEDDKIVTGYGIDIDIYGSDKSEFEVEIEKGSTGSSISEALENIEEMEFDYIWRNDTLFISPVILIDLKTKYHGQYAEINIFLPEDKVLYLDKSLQRIDSPGYGDDYLETPITYDGDDIKKNQ